MMEALSIAFKDLQVLWRDRGSLIQLFLLPLVFILVFLGLAAAAVSGEAEADARTELIVVNDDPDGELSADLLRRLEDGGIAPELVARQEAQTLLDAGDVSLVLFIPSDFSAKVAVGDQVQLRLANSGASSEQTESILLVVEGVARDMSLEQQIFASIVRMGEMQAANPDAVQAFSVERATQQARQQFAAAESRPLVAVNETAPRNFDPVDLEQLSTVSVAVSGWAVLFVFLTGQTTAQSIFEEKRFGSFRRLLAAPISKATILTGKVSLNFMMVIVQFVVIFGVSMLVLPLLDVGELDLGRDFLALFLLILVTAVCSTAVGVLIAGIARTEAQVGGVSAVVLWVMALLGGAFIRLYLINPDLAAISQLTPHYWAIIGFDDLLLRGGGLVDIVDSLLALLGFSAVFALVGLWRFEFD